MRRKALANSLHLVAPRVLTTALERSARWPDSARERAAGEAGKIEGVDVAQKLDEPLDAMIETRLALGGGRVRGVARQAKRPRARPIQVDGPIVASLDVSTSCLIGRPGRGNAITRSVSSCRRAQLALRVRFARAAEGCSSPPTDRCAAVRSARNRGCCRIRAPE